MTAFKFNLTQPVRSLAPVLQLFDQQGRSHSYIRAGGSIEVGLRDWRDGSATVTHLPAFFTLDDLTAVEIEAASAATKDVASIRLAVIPMKIGFFIRIPRLINKEKRGASF